MTNSKHILLVEDDTTLNFIIRDNLEEAGYTVCAAQDGQEALEEFKKGSFDICLLDVMLPKLDGFSVAKEIRQSNQDIPILFLTAKNLGEDRVKGFNMGGDDYITKPFSMEELLLRIQVFLKRSQVNMPPSNKEINLCQVGQYTFNFPELYLDLKGERKTLTYKEAELLQFFCKNPNEVMSRADILKNVWGSDDYYLGRSLDVFISRLRKYLKDDESIKIVNLHGIGFRFNAKVQEH